MFVGKMPIKDLEIDLPVSETNVQQKVESLKANGLIQPVAVWLGPTGKPDKPRIIDGFHRVVAAERLGWTDINCNQIDCSEEGFWDARIQSAKQHHDIETDRLLAWIGECWKSSQLKDEDDAIHDLATEVWETGLFSAEGTRKLPIDLEKKGRVHQWIRDHALRWQVPPYSIIRAIMARYGFDGNHDQFNVATQARRAGLSFDEAVTLRKQTEHVSRVLGSPEGGSYGTDVGSFLEDSTRLSDDFATHVKMRGLADRLGHDAKNAEQREHAERREAQERIRQERETFRRIRDSLVNTYDRLFTILHSDNDVLQQMPDGPEILAEFAVLVRDAIADLWPSSRVERWEVPSVLEENAKLRRALHQEHHLRIQAEAALLQGQERAAKLQEKLTDVIAWPGD